MKFQITALLIFSFLVAGCAGTVKEHAPEGVEENLPKEILVPVKAEAQATDSKQLVNAGKDKIDQYVQVKGIVFGKTNFSGLLETVYVKLQIESLTDVTQKYQLLVTGEDKEGKTFPWDVKSVKPGYFFIELPEGNYRLAGITIPVGTTVAMEPMSIDFKVYPHAVVYIGTLTVLGTKEKIRLGGVPIIKPGFEYEVSVLDEREEAIKSINASFPELPKKLKFDLMKINPLPNPSL